MSGITRRIALAMVAASIGSASRPAEAADRIRVSGDGRGFIHSDGRAFRPWGFNYDHDERNRLLEDYWHDEWAKVEADFREMKELGANVVRVHLQLGRFMEAADRPNATNLARLGELCKLAERTGLLLDLTGLGCYKKADVPPWYDALDESERWSVQARFWEAIARTCAASPAVFCYDLMNEPVVPGGRRAPGDWLGPPFGDRCFVQFITLDQADRPRPDIARAWVRRLVEAVRAHDRDHMITVGLVDWSLDRPGLTSGFVPQAIVPEVDFLAVHLYPQGGKVDEALETLRGFVFGKPIVIEETFLLSCSGAELRRFLRESRGTAAGWIGFYWGQTPAELSHPKTLSEAITAEWLKIFQEEGKDLGN
jgi:hypothetical protein